jgi:hypothetical protein
MGKKKIDYKKEYAELLGTGMFWEWFPSLTGNWDEDKMQFEVLWNEKREIYNGK